MTAQPLEYDTFAFSQTLRGWNFELSNGDYDVRVVSGDASYAQGPHRVSAQSITAIQDLPTAANVFVGPAPLAAVPSRSQLYA